MINNLLDEIVNNIQNSLDDQKYKSLALDNNKKLKLLIYKRKEYLKHPCIQITFLPDGIFNIYADILIEPSNKKTTIPNELKKFVLMVNQYHPKSMGFYAYDKIEIADFIDYIKNKLK